MMTHDEMITVIQAHKEGKTIEACAIGYANCWRVTADPPTWNFYVMDYRVKPEPPKPREFWLGLHKHITTGDGGVQACVATYRQRPITCSGDEIIHVREVLP